MNNLRFSTAVHILVLLDFFKDELISSDFISKSIGVNAVIVRKEIISLREAGFIDCKRGKIGGYKLKKDANSILLSDIYRAVNPKNIGKYNDPNPKCPVGVKINDSLENIFSKIEASIYASLSDTTLRSFKEMTGN